MSSQTDLIKILQAQTEDQERRISALEKHRDTLLEGIVVEQSPTITEVRHGLGGRLGREPKSVTPVPRSDARVWQAKKATATSLFLSASTSVTVDIYVS